MENTDPAELAEQATNPFKTYCALLVSVLAMVLAINNLGGSNTGKDAMMNNILASNMYSFYQAKSLKQTQYKIAADELEIQLAEKQIKEMKASMEHKKEIIANSKEKLEAKSSHLKHKKSELDAIMAETQKEELFLSEKSAEFEAQIEERLLAAYKRIRSSVRNGLAVVSIERGASAGSFFTIPPQTQVEIASRKKIITDEHSGRILVDSALADEEKEKMENLFSKF